MEGNNGNIEKELTEEQMKEVNERVREIVSTLRLAVINTAGYDYSNYWKFGMRGDPEHVAFRKLFNVKEEFVRYIEKETMLVCSDDKQFYQNKRRKLKEEIIDELMEFLDPQLRGRVDGNRIWRRVVNISDKLIDRAERLNDDGLDYKNTEIRKPRNLGEAPVFELKYESL